MRKAIVTIGAVLAAGLGIGLVAGPAMASTSPINAYYYNAQGTALGGPQPGTDFSFSNGHVAKIVASQNKANIVGKTITITGHLDPGTAGTLTDRANGGDPTGASPTARVYFQGTSGGTTTGSPQGYMGQQWWSDGQFTYLNTLTGEFTWQATVSPDPGAWSDWNGQQASDNAALFNAAASHVSQIGLSFGGGYFFENGVTGSGGITIDSITVQ
jgi:hypothetical protein